MQKFLSELFKKRYTFVVYLKSGATIRLRAEDAELGHNNETGQVNSYRFVGLKSRRPIYIIPSDIVALTME